jgi:hypothetical protein
MLTHKPTLPHSHEISRNHHDDPDGGSKIHDDDTTPVTIATTRHNLHKPFGSVSGRPRRGLLETIKIDLGNEHTHRR